MGIRRDTRINVGSREVRHVDLVRASGISAGVVRRQKGTALNYQDTSDFPATDDAVNESIAATEEPFCFAERQFIKVRRQEAMTAVIDYVSVVETRVKAIGGPVTAGGHEAARVSTPFV